MGSGRIQNDRLSEATHNDGQYSRAENLYLEIELKILRKIPQKFTKITYRT